MFINSVLNWVPLFVLLGLFMYIDRFRKCFPGSHKDGSYSCIEDREADFTKYFFFFDLYKRILL